MPASQSIKNHARVDLVHHPAVFILLLNVIVAIIWAFVSHTPGLPLRMWVVILSIALLIASVKARTNPIVVQDRLIRLEEQLRYQTLLSPAQLAVARALPLRSIIALRFASDAELPYLVDRAAKEQLTPKQIKMAIGIWRSDTSRV